MNIAAGVRTAISLIFDTAFPFVAENQFLGFSGSCFEIQTPAGGESRLNRPAAFGTYEWPQSAWSNGPDGSFIMELSLRGYQVTALELENLYRTDTYLRWR